MNSTNVGDNNNDTNLRCGVPTKKLELNERWCVSSENKARKNVCLISSPYYNYISCLLGVVKSRAVYLHTLLNAYNLATKLKLVAPRSATVEELVKFHSLPFISLVKSINDDVDGERLFEMSDQESFGLAYDCPFFKHAFTYASLICGASITAAECLISGEHRIAINWNGGWHHAKREQASGYCYFNDVVLAIMKLQEKFKRILYIDLDLHHGDGVQEAFYATPSVLSISFHKFSPGFFPGTGSTNETGSGYGQYYNINIPLSDGATDQLFCQLFDRSMRLVEIYDPEAIVCQCGADGLVLDKMNSFNLTPKSFVHCVTKLSQFNLPLLLLGGGGYNATATARCWTSVTAAILQVPLSPEIPDHELFLEYGPDYQLTIEPGNRRNENTPEAVDILYTFIDDMCARLKEAGDCSKKDISPTARRQPTIPITDFDTTTSPPSMKLTKKNESSENVEITAPNVTMMNNYEFKSKSNELESKVLQFDLNEFKDTNDDTKKDTKIVAEKTIDFICDTVSRLCKSAEDNHVDNKRKEIDGRKHMLLRPDFQFKSSFVDSAPTSTVVTDITNTAAANHRLTATATTDEVTSSLKSDSNGKSISPLKRGHFRLPNSYNTTSSVGAAREMGSAVRRSDQNWPATGASGTKRNASGDPCRKTTSAVDTTTVSVSSASVYDFP